jgi:hypothetical protein
MGVASTVTKKTASTGASTAASTTVNQTARTVPK